MTAASRTAPAPARPEPTGPRGAPILGHVVSYARDPLGFLERLARRHGDVARFRLGSTPVFFVNDPRLIKELFLYRQRSFAKSRAMQVAKRVVGEGLLTSEGEEHHRQRRMADPAFHRKTIGSYADVVVRGGLRAQRGWRDGAPVDFEQEMLRLTLPIVGETLFGADLRDQAERIGAALTDAMDHLMTVMLPFGEVVAKLPVPSTLRFRRARDLLDGTIAEIIDARRRGGELREDLLSILLEQEGERAIHDQVMTIFLTGFETIATALTWTFFLLSQDAAAERALHAEVDSVLGERPATAADLPALAYTRRVLAESMRLFPPAWGISRRAIEDTSLGPYAIPKDAIVLVSQYITQRDARFFSDPSRFDPDRWTRSGQTERDVELAYFPFGGGGRRCIGEQLAWAEGTLLVATLAQRWRVRVASDRPPALRPLVSLRPRGGLPAVLERRG